MSNCKTIGAVSSRLVALASAVCLLGNRPGAGVDTANAQHSVTVSYRDLNLSRSMVPPPFYRRISGAAR